MSTKETKHPVHENGFMTAKQACQYLQIGYSTLRLLVKQGEIPGHKIGNRWRFRRSDLDQALRRTD